MGCDGGTIPKRDELVRTKKKPEQKDKTSELSFRWNHCAITQQPLQPPIVACEMGRLYSKESVLETLLDKSEDNASKEMVPHLKSLKDIKELSLTPNPDWIDLVRGETGDSYIDVQKARWICPLSGMEMNGRFRFCFLWNCGCVLSEKALKEMVKFKEEGNDCPNCSKKFQVLDIVLLNPVDEVDVMNLKEKMDLRRILAKEAKEAKKAGKKRAATTSTSATVTSESNGSSSSSSEEKGGKNSTSTPSESSASAKSAEPASSSKRPKIVSNPKMPSAAAAAAAETNKYSVAKDPKASEVYKSLFTTHQNASTQERAHWITYNPFYN